MGSDTPRRVQAVQRYLEELERELKKVPGVTPEEALSDAREFLQDECEALPERTTPPDDERLLAHFYEVFGLPSEVAAAYAGSVEPVLKRAGHAPQWRICCTRCGRSAPASDAGIVRIGARSWHKYVLGFCRECGRTRWLRLIRDLEQPTLTRGLGQDRTPEQLRRRMHRPWTTVAACVVVAVALPWIVWGAQHLARRGSGPATPFGDLPAGWQITQSTAVAPHQRDAVAQRLGARITTLTNTVLNVHGQSLKVCTIEAATLDDAQQIEKSLVRIHQSARMVRRDGTKLTELVSADARLALDAKYRLGIQPKKVRYRVAFDAAPITSANDMRWNAMFNAFLELDRAGENQNAAAGAKIAELAKEFRFGDGFAVRRCGQGPTPSSFTFEPKPTRSQDLGDVLTRFDFPSLPLKAGVPCVSVTVDVTSETYARVPAHRAPPKELTAATRRWPSEDPAIVELARQIAQSPTENHPGGISGTFGTETPTGSWTGSKQASEDRQRVQAILDWMMPGRNLKFQGPVAGSRYGVPQILKQRFGHCWDFSDCFITLCRANGLPCRQVAGWLAGSEGHIWAEVYTDGGWLQVDPTAGMACGSDYIPYLTSEDGEMPLVYLSAVRIDVLESDY